MCPVADVRFVNVLFFRSVFSNSNYTTSNITEPNRNTDIQLNNQINAAIIASEFINDVEMENGHISNGKFD